MATKRKSPTDHGGNSFPVRLGQHNNFFRFEDFEDDKSVVLMEAHLEMMQKFINFCKEKKVKYVQELPDKTKLNLHEENEESFKRNAFKEKLTTYFGEHLPPDVVDELCNLVQDNSYGKCHYCGLPAESLVLSVLQILHDASQNLGKKTHGSQIAHSSHACRNAPVCNNHDANFNSMNKKAPPASDIVHGKPPSTNGENGKYAASDKGLHHSTYNIYNGIEATKSFQNQVKANHVPILDTPVFLFGREFSRNTSVSSQHAPAMPMNPKSKPNRFISKLHLPAVPSLQASIPNPIKDVSPKVYIFKETKSKGRSLDMGELADQLYNKKNLNIRMSNNMTHVVEDHSLEHQKSSRRFNVSETEMRYYKVFCGLAHSQWSCFEGVKLFKTSVTYQSLGESIEPLGHVDNFFIAGYCRKLFDDSHPKESRKHFFYPRIGLCLLSYISTYEANTVKNSFLGANSALKFHLADKLCFPIFHAHIKHWSVFIVDLRLKLFVFLDSMFGENDSIQIETRDSIIPAFKECWYEHAEVKLDLDVFSVVYPPVPKQNNIHDCGIFAIKFMELWDNSMDLRHVFDQSDIPSLRVKGIDPRGM
ncbi:unnamed protein product [Miscanthus lutarioriparius]|uniref:Ubiquitin-like protease family profile domain-containing protein n=1 Tax=Miscanthus lutarioriparius TaxID=422564 RepID=A0A811QRR2_9POAL|nr:unnamed protein product [Miscanthus lutarioriparius]